MGGHVEDIIQAAQALKESKPEPTGELETSLVDLWLSLKELRTYCNDVRPESLAYPFSRPEMQVREALCCLYLERPHVKKFRLGSYHFSRLLKGLWQLSSPARASGTAEEQRTALARLAPAIGDQVYAATKWCVFGPVGHPIMTERVLAQMKERCQVELLRTHRDRETAPGACARDRAVQFDAEHALEACEYLLGNTGAVGIMSDQPASQLLTRGLEAASEDVRRPAPTICAESESLTPSQRKGDWTEFQGLLAVLSAVARKHGLALTNVATRWVLQQPVVGAVIVRTGPGVVAHGGENAEVSGSELEDSDLATINAVAFGWGPRETDAVFYKRGHRGNEHRAMHELRGVRGS
ncbi:hypothetical protein DL771_007895 [Monosporascus sp. 5C6A]|nr:hypothetical protein DL771_007895 [Monosporascus sp. 5C6A]